MNPNSIVVEGVVTPEGTLQLTGTISLPAGKVEVTVRSFTAPVAQEDWWQFMLRSRRELEATGTHFLNEHEMNAQLEWLRESDRIDDLLQQADRDRPAC